MILDSPRLLLSEDATSNIQILLRWVHFIAGITWVGLLYFFNLVNMPFMRELDAPTRARIMPPLMSRALWWFRWSAVVTVLAGIWYWMMIVGADKRSAQAIGVDAGGGMAIGTFFGIWTVAFAIEMGLLMSPADVLKKGAVFGGIMTVVLAGGAWLYLDLNSHGWESSRLLAIGIGGGFGWFMLLNVWGLLWRAQKKIIRWTRESTANGTPMPEGAAALMRLSQLVARLNFVLSFPMLLCMGMASHYAIFKS